MVNVNGPRIASQNLATAATARVATPPPADQNVVDVGRFQLSQSGNVMPGNYGNGPSTPVADPKRFDRLEIKALDQNHVGTTTSFQLDERGAPRPNPKQPPWATCRTRSP